MASGALARRDEPSNVYDQFRLLDVHLLNLTTTARALRIRLRVLWSYSVALERRAKETSQLNKSYAEATPPVEVTSVPAAGGAPIRESEVQKIQAAQKTQKRRETDVLLA
ncbi:hypothetical protein A1F94_003796 [Pyrenophora tritici-repentis]|uniref:Uncharacterized protein n=2 Tax=Pyrenophora tritici-repentis TaxID=45151 RepID=A0A2W1CS71_9PLEO|nr:uncharacterized protein PTRG_11787 [Pyrenophora tritici-repentis Pt-1C-BFP]KAA8623712.1 hypothetical protein PtrV1_05018 [Pyrenophora tritici-repentis]EDU45943.1 predicted protein [Pyrenophora tritici-repentis Pt-1C-BFP]KAF7452691.1 hypothetical protein A1F99_044690 [Pyrenophora tritici-repentis]KAG9387046.1 hypothetical protein A1F94_003796 [Pyrenophora tritici-repentis]KAI1508929.1 hypothetical protein Ptr86124_012228 [Pyrenophora tritici-repentis]